MSKRKAQNDWPKIRKRKTKVKGHEYTYYVVDCGIVDGRRATKSFKPTEDGRLPREAEKWAEQKRRERARLGLDALRLSDQQKLDAIKALHVLGGRGTLQEAVEFFVERRNPETKGLLLSQVIQEYLQEAEEDNLRPRSIQDLRNRLRKLDEFFDGKQISNITKSQVEEWLKGMRRADGEPLSSLSKRHFRTVASGLFNYALENGHVPANPFANRSQRRRRGGGLRDERLPSILRVAEVRDFLHAAQTTVPRIAPALAIGFFAGLRTTELQQVRWQHVDLQTRLITVPPHIAKKRSVRHVDISDNLMAWLLLYHQGPGPIGLGDSQWWHALHKAQKAAGLSNWPHNVMRHCFASYHLAMFQNQNLTALQLGHRDTDLLYNHYRNLVKPPDAERYWNIRPKVEGKVIQLPGVAS